MELTFVQQSTAFLFSVLLGLVLGAVYGIFKLLRCIFRFSKTAVFISDVVYMLICALMIFYFSLAYLYGYIRIYVFVGTASGIIAYRLTLGRIVDLVLFKCLGFFGKILSKICFYFKKILKKLLKTYNKVLYNKHRKIENKSNGIDRDTLENQRITDKNEKRKSEFSA